MQLNLYLRKKKKRNKNGLKSLNNLLIMSCNISGIESCTYHHILFIQMITYCITCKDYCRSIETSVVLNC